MQCNVVRAAAVAMILDDVTGFRNGIFVLIKFGDRRSCGDRWGRKSGKKEDGQGI